MQFAFCNFNEGFDASSLEQFQADYHAWLKDYEVDNGATGYWYVALEPLFDPEPKPDFVWLHLWADAEEKATGMTAFGQSDLAASVNTMSSCENYDFSGQSIRG